MNMRNGTGILPWMLFSLLPILSAACGGNSGKFTAGENALEPAPAATGYYVAEDESSVMMRQAEPKSEEDDGVLPEDLSEEDYAKIVENPFVEAVREPLSTFSIDVDAASYSNTRRYIRSGAMPPPDAVRIEELINYFSYDYPQPVGNVPFSITTEAARAPWNQEHLLVQVGLQGKKMEMGELPPSNLVFLIDVSGSMESPDKLGLLKQAFRLLVEQLRENDRVSIAVYAGAAGLVLPPTPGSDKTTILTALENLQAGGSTAGGEGILLAYRVASNNFLKNGNNRVILATDGDFNVGVSDHDGLQKLIEEKREEGVFLTVLGFGRGNLQDATMELLADKGNGHYAYIDTELEARKVFVGELGATLMTIAKDVKIQVEFNPEVVKEYRLIGYENRLLATEDFDDDTKDAGELGAGHSVTALYEIVPVSGSAVRGERRTPWLDDGTGRRPTEEFAPAVFGKNQVMQIKLRYKQPDADRSELITAPAVLADIPMEKASANMQFAAAVAQWGLLLRNSAHKGNASFADVQILARRALKFDPDGYRAEFLDLVKESERVARIN